MMLLCTQMNAQSLWTPIDTNAVLVENGSMINGQTRFIDLYNHPFKKNKWWAVSPEAGLFVSSDACSHFNLCKGSNLLPETPLSTVAVDPLNDRIIYLGTGDPSRWIQGKGLWKSFNGGETFVKLSLPDCIVTAIDISPANRQLLLVATSQGIFRSLNGGVTFNLISNTNGIAFTDLKRTSAANSKTIYACGFSDFFVSYNDGVSWNVSNNGIQFNSQNNFGFGGRIAVSPLDTNLLYVAFGANNGSVFLSYDKGASFVAMKNNLFPNLLATHNDSLLSHSGNYAFAIQIGNSVDKVFFFGQNIFSSNDTARTFNQLTNYKTIIPGGIHKAIFSNNDTIRIATDGGIYTTTNSGVSFTQSVFPLGFFNCHSGDASKKIKNCITFITPDQGEFYYLHHQFKNIRNPPFSSNCRLSNNSSPIVFYNNTGTFRPLNSNQEHSVIQGESSFDAIAFSESDSNTAFVSTSSGIYRFNFNEASSTLIHTTPSNVKELVFDDSALYALTNDHHLLYCTNVYTDSCSFISRLFPGTSTDYHLLKSKSGELLLTCGDSMFVSINDGTSWQPFNHGLPLNIVWKSIVEDPYTPGLFFAAGGTNDVYYRKPNNNFWLPFNSGLPSRIPITDLRIFPSPNNDVNLYLFYQGVGIQCASFDSLRSVNAAFESDKRSICKGNYIRFKNLSRGAINGIEWLFPGGNPSASTNAEPIVRYDSSGTFDVKLIAKGLNSTDTIILANYISTLADSILPHESFDSSFSFIDSIINGGESYYQWKKVNTYSSHNSVMQFENFLHNEQGEKDILQSKRIKLPAHKAARLLFDVAYAAYDSINSDTLEIQVSTDCGNSFETIYSRSGNKLATCPPQQSYFSPDSTQWRTDTLQLSSYAGSDNVIFRFNNIGHYGNNIYLDNIRIDTNFIQTEFDFHVNVLIQGLYEGNKLMRPLLYNLGIRDDPNACDSISIELVSPTLSFQQTCLLNIFGESTISVPSIFSEIPVYLKVSHRNSIPVYSKELIVPKKLGYNLYDFTKNNHP